MENLQNRRKNYYIKKQFQRNFILKFCALVVAGSAITGLVIYLMSRSAVCTSFENSRLVIKSTADFILPAVLLSSAVSVILISLATIVITLFASHKIAGPLYRLEKDVQEIASGNLKVVFRLREDDELKALLGSMNDMVNALRGRIAGAKEGLKTLESSSGISAEARDGVRRIREALEAFKI